MRIVILLFILSGYICAAQTNSVVVSFDHDAKSIFKEANADAWFKKDALFSTVLGGAIALAGSWAVHRWQVRKEEKSEKQFIRSVLLALKTEIQMLQQTYDAGIGKNLKETPAGSPLLWKLAFSQSHFTVYETNTAQIGRFPQEVGVPIVKLYALMKVSIEEFGINNNYIEKYDVLSRNSLIGGKVEFLSHVELMVRHVEGLRALDKAIHELAAEVLELLEKHAPERG